MWIIVAILFLLIARYRPSLDRTSENELLLWYDSNNGRKYINLTKKIK